MRGFKTAKGWEVKEVNLPKRQTKHAAGYDFEAAEDVTIPPFWKQLFDLRQIGEEKVKLWNSFKLLEPTLVHTGISSYMKEDEALFLYNRSSGPIKRFLLLSNGVGCVDSDFEDEIRFQFINFGFFPVTIKKGERIGQGVFQKFLLADGDEADGKRKGGHGSTDEKTK